MSTTLRFISSSLGVAVIATLVQSNTKFHYAHLAERVTATSPLGQLVPRLQALFMFHGGSASASYIAALQEVQGLVERQAYVLAIQDAFWLSFVLALVAIVATIFVGGRRKSASAPDLSQLSDEEREEAERAREEAMIGG
jgi:DHA2 family multidrug resistance protein